MNTEYQRTDDILSPESKLASELSAALMDDNRTKDAAIEVINEHGVITLDGQVNDHETRSAAEQIVKRHASVISVINSLKVV